MSKLHFHYSPEGVERRTWEFVPLKMTNTEAEAVEELTDLTFMEWQDKLLRGSAVCIRAYLYVLLKRDKPKLTFDQVAFSMGEVGFEVEDGNDDGADVEATDPKDEPDSPSPSE